MLSIIKEPILDLRNSVNEKNINKFEGPDKVIDVFERILNFDKQQQVIGLKLLTPN